MTDDIKKKICEIGFRMYDKNLIVAGEGNISCRVSDGEIWVTPSGVSKGFLEPGMLSLVDISGNVLNGINPSSEVKMHLNIYRKLPGISAVVHAHPAFATSYAAAGKPLDDFYLAESVVSLGVVPVTPFALPSTWELASSCDPYLDSCSALLLGNHGALTWDETLDAALFKMETIEQTAKISFLAKMLCAQKLSPDKVEKLIALREI